MALLLKAIATDDRALWAQCLKDRLPRILRLINNYERALQSNRNANGILLQIFDSLQTTLRSAIALTDMPPENHDIKKKLIQLMIEMKRLRNIKLKKIIKKKVKVKMMKREVPRWVV